MIRSKHNKNKSRADAATTSRAQFSHFALGAFSQLTMNLAEYAKGLDISSPEARTNAPRTVDFINDVLNSFPGVYRVSSTVRSEAHNKAVGGVANSYHLNRRAGAVDFMPVDGHFTEQKRANLKAKADKHGFGLLAHNVKTGMHYHCEIKKPVRPR